jgi:hypothetical protein
MFVEKKCLRHAIRIHNFLGYHQKLSKIGGNFNFYAISKAIIKNLRSMSNKLKKYVLSIIYGIFSTYQFRFLSQF